MVKQKNKLLSFWLIISLEAKDLESFDCAAIQSSKPATLGARTVSPVCKLLPRAFGRNIEFC